MAMERLADEGLCKSIGISNFSVAKSQELIQTCRHPPVVNQVSMGWLAAGACQLYLLHVVSPCMPFSAVQAWWLLTGVVVLQVEMHPYWRQDKLYHYGNSMVRPWALCI